MKPTVKLISYTENALELLLYTKNTRLDGAQSLQDIMMWPEQKKYDHLMYMKDTIKSSWEFVDFVFEIQGVDRAFTHQLVRTRNGSYAQQSQRTVDVRKSGYTPIDPPHHLYDVAVRSSLGQYAVMVDDGVPVQDARGVLPTAIETSIIAKFNLRTLHEMAQVRLCKRTQGLYQEVFKLMNDRVCGVYPWARHFIKVACAWNGVCVFPRYKECPVQKHTISATGAKMKDIEKAWRESDHVANPQAKDGRTM